jgi:hypothetical protein
MEQTRRKSIMKSKMKEISLTLAVEVAEDVAPEEVAARLEKALVGLDGQVARLSDVVVRTVPRFDGPAAGGYESRIWEKATCKATNDPRERLEDPVTEIERLSEQAKRLESEIASLHANLNRLKNAQGR